MFKKAGSSQLLVPYFYSVIEIRLRSMPSKEGEKGNFHEHVSAYKNCTHFIILDEGFPLPVGCITQVVIVQLLDGCLFLVLLIKFLNLI